jgi:RHS repeat-associated protein
MKIVKYFYDRENLLSVHDSSLPFPLIYIHSEGIDDPVILRYGEKSYYFVKDHLGSVRKVIDSSGSVFNSYDYDSFGRPIDFTETIPSHFHFTGREFDQESGLYYYRARYYDSSTGRFLSEDPIGFLGGVNLYFYVKNNPLNFIDHFGLKECEDCDKIFSLCLGRAVAGMLIPIPLFEELIFENKITENTILETFPYGASQLKRYFEERAWRHQTRGGKRIIFGMPYPKKSSIWRGLMQKAQLFKRVSILISLGLGLNDIIDCYNKKLECEIREILAQ